MTTKVNPQVETQTNSATGSKIEPKTTAEKATRLITEYYQGLTEGLTQPYKSLYKEVKLEGEAYYKAFQAARNGDYGKAADIIKEEFYRTLEPFKAFYNKYINNKIK